MPVLVDVPVVAVSLVGATDPQVVRIVVSNLTAGQVVAITGSAAGSTWQVRGGSVVATGTQVVLVDVLAPVNVPVTYTVNVDGTDYAADPVTVPYSGRYVLQSLDGRTVIPIEVWWDNGLPTSLHLRSVSYPVPGRHDSPARWDVAAGESTTAVMRLSTSATQALRTHLLTDAPMLAIRTDGAVRDVPPSQLWLLTSADRVLFGAVALGVKSTDRVWTIGYDVIDDPEPSTIVPASTWDDFDGVYAASTWDAFDTEWATSTWDDFDATDWTSH